MNEISNTLNQITTNLSEYYFYQREELIELIPTTAKSLLDVGCGAGVFSSNIKKRQPIEIHGVELISEAAKYAQKHLDRVWNLSIEEALPQLPEHYYDCILAADVLEHLCNPWAVLKSLKGKLKQNGKIIVSIPNIQNWDVLSELIQGKWDYQSKGILDSTHLRFFTRKTTEELFYTAGLQIINISTTKRGPPPTPNLLKTLTKFDLSVNSLEKDGQTLQFLIEATKPIQEETPKISIVILNWNGERDTIECLESIEKLDYLNYNVIVVDNGSADKSVEKIKNLFPKVTILQTGSNLGYAGGNNVGINYALRNQADYILILNNDTVVDKFLLSNLVRTAMLDQQIGIVGPTNFYYDSPEKIWTIGAVINNPSYLGYKTIGDGDQQHHWENTISLDAIVGSAMLVRRNIFEEIGLFDERYFLCYEELDFCARARKSGYKCIFVPEAKIWHKVGSSLGEIESPLRVYYLIRNRPLWVKKNLSLFSRINLVKEHLSIVSKIIFPLFVITNTDLPIYKKLLWAFSTWIKTLKRNINNSQNQATLIGLRDFYAGRFGMCPDSIWKLQKIHSNNISSKISN